MIGLSQGLKEYKKMFKSDKALHTPISGKKTKTKKERKLIKKTRLTLVEVFVFHFSPFKQTVSHWGIQKTLISLHIITIIVFFKYFLLGRRIFFFCIFSFFLE